MPRVSDLTQLDFTPNQAKHLGAISDGAEGTFSALTATGNNSQANAYQLIANHNIFTTVTSTNNSCKLPLAINDPYGTYIIRNKDTDQNLYLFPAVGDSLNDLAANTATQIAYDGFAIAVKQSNTSWLVIKGNSALVLPTVFGGTGQSLGRVNFTAGTLTPNVGTVTGGTKEGYYQTTQDMIYFAIDIAGWTQNTSAATTYTIPLPVTAVSTRRMFFTTYDRTAGAVIIGGTESSNSTITFRKPGGGTWAAGGGVNIVVNGFYWWN